MFVIRVLGDLICVVREVSHRSLVEVRGLRPGGTGTDAVSRSPQYDPLIDAHTTEDTNQCTGQEIASGNSSRGTRNLSGTSLL